MFLFIAWLLIGLFLVFILVMILFGFLRAGRRARQYETELDLKGETLSRQQLSEKIREERRKLLALEDEAEEAQGKPHSEGD